MSADVCRDPEVRRVYESLTPKPKQLLGNAQRVFLREGELLCHSSSEAKQKRYHCFLFNDLLLLTKRETKKFWLRVLVVLRNSGAGEVRVDNVTDSRWKMPDCEFRVYCPKKTLIFFAASPSAKQQWLVDLQRATEPPHVRRARIDAARAQHAEQQRKHAAQLDAPHQAQLQPQQQLQPPQQQQQQPPQPQQLQQPQQPQPQSHAHATTAPVVDDDPFASFAASRAAHSSASHASSSSPPPQQQQQPTTTTTMYSHSPAAAMQAQLPHLAQPPPPHHPHVQQPQPVMFTSTAPTTTMPHGAAAMPMMAMPAPTAQPMLVQQADGSVVQVLMQSHAPAFAPVPVSATTMSTTTTMPMATTTMPMATTMPQQQQQQQQQQFDARPASPMAPMGTPASPRSSDDHGGDAYEQW